MTTSTMYYIDGHDVRLDDMCKHDDYVFYRHTMIHDSFGCYCVHCGFVTSIRQNNMLIGHNRPIDKLIIPTL